MIRAIRHTYILALSIAIYSVCVSASTEGEESSQFEESIEEVLVEGAISKVRYVYPIRDSELSSSPLGFLQEFPSLALDNSFGQVRSRGAEANHIGIHIDGYDIGDPVTDFNFATMSCAGIDLLTFSATPSSGSIAGVLNMRSSNEKRRNISVSHGSAGQLLQFDYGDQGHNLTMSHRYWEGIDVREDGDIDGVQNQLVHYHFRSGNWESTIRYAAVEQDYDRGFAEIDQGLVGITGELFERIEMRFSNSFNRVSWYESFNNNTVGTRTNLWFSMPIIKSGEVKVGKTYDVNKSEVLGDPTRKPIGVTHAKASYDNSMGSFSLRASISYIDSSQDEAVTPTSMHLSWKVSRFMNSLGQLVVFTEFDHQTISFPSMVDRYGWGQSWLPNPNVKPERGTGISTGIRITSSDYSIQLTRFSLRLRDKIAFGRNVSENADYGRNRGFELTWSQFWKPGLTSSMSYSNLDSEARNTPNEPYLRTQRRPSNQFSGRVTYSVSQLDSVITIRWVNKAIDACWRGCITLDAYSTVDLSLSYQWTEALNTTLSVYNATDSVYSHAFGYNSPPRQASVGIQWRL